MDEFGLSIVDESMVGWVPKLSKLGDLPNYTLEPRKPTPLGTMLKDIAEPTTGMLLYTDPCMSPSVQDKKPFAQAKSQSPEHAGINKVHCRDTKASFFSGMQPGSWLSGDAWFRSIASCMVLKLEPVRHMDEDGDEHEHALGVESAFVVKNSVSLFPPNPGTIEMSHALS